MGGAPRAEHSFSFPPLVLDPVNVQAPVHPAHTSMDPYQRLVDFSKVVSGERKNTAEDKALESSLDSLKIEKNEPKTPAETFKALRGISDIREANMIISKACDPSDLRALQVRLDPAMIRRDAMARKKYLMDKFPDVAIRSMKRRRRIDAALEPYSRFVHKTTANVTVIPTKTTSAVYLGKIFKYAVKRTILEHRREMGGDPWDEFFYRVYSINKESMRLEFSAEEIAPRAEEQPEPTARLAKVSDDLMKGGGEQARTPSPHMMALVGSLPEKEDIPKKKRIPKTYIPPSAHPRFRFGKVPHSPDGRTSLTRMFYLPLLDHSENVG